MRRIALCVLCLLIGQAAFSAHAQDTQFPVIVSTEVFPYDNVRRFSNGARYYQEFSSRNKIRNTQTERLVFYDPDPYWTASSWSPNNALIAFLRWGPACTPSDSDGNLFLFHTENETTTQHCLPFSDGEMESLEWSPFDANVLALVGPNYLFNVVTQELTAFSFPTDIDPESVTHYEGYGHLLWDPITRLPAARLYLEDTYDFDIMPEGFITSSIFTMCAETCVPILDTLNVVDAEVKVWQLNGHWLLWEAIWSITGLPTMTSSVSDIADTSVFLTDLRSGATQELIRFSRLGIDDLRAFYLGWSPDATLVTLELDNPEPIDYNVLPTAIPGINHPLRYGTLLITLDWSP